jgi:hypothetical protein
MARRWAHAALLLAAAALAARPTAARGVHTLAQLSLVHIITDPLARGRARRGRDAPGAPRASGLRHRGAPLAHTRPHPQAVCNDGTRPGYFYRQSSTQASQFDWLIYLQGGDWCAAARGCGCGGRALGR